MAKVKEDKKTKEDKKKTYKKKENGKNDTGRPKVEIDYEVVEKLANLMCTYEEIADYFAVSLAKLEKDAEFVRVHKRGIGKGKMSLRRSQKKLADEGSATMCIWLGKQYLKQKDQQKVEHSGEVPVKIVDDIK